ncbi:hypothetical protein [Polaribacter sp.]|uniref:hypothetical protein n=1 Tax=Polaribacter sp. TaxID=1920175 RepID=UPI003F698A02
MKTYYTIIVILLTLGGVKAQTLVHQDFESLEKGSDVLKARPNRLFAWGKSTWTVTEKKGKGFMGSDKFATSGDEVNETLVKYTDLEVGKTYVFSVAVKLTNVNQSWKGAYSVKAIYPESKENIYQYAVEEVKEAKVGKWKKHSLEFTVVEGKENVVLNVYRWAKDVKMHVDDFMLTEK